MLLLHVGVDVDVDMDSAYKHRDSGKKTNWNERLSGKKSR